MLTLKRAVTRARYVHLIEGSLQHLHEIRQTGFAGEPDEDPMNAHPEETPSGQAHAGLPYARQVS